MKRQTNVAAWRRRAYPRLRHTGQELKALGYLIANQSGEEPPIGTDEDTREGLGRLLHRLGSKLTRMAKEMDEAFLDEKNKTAE